MKLTDRIERRPILAAFGARRGGTGNVDKVGQPVTGRVAYWAGDGTLGHDAAATYDAGTGTLTIDQLAIGDVVFDGKNQLPDPGADRLIGWDDSAGRAAYFAPVGGLEISGNVLRMTANQRMRAIEFVIDDGGTTISPGMKGFLQVPFDCMIRSARLLADQPGSIIVDVWKGDYANYPPTETGSITGATPPSIVSGQKSQDTALTGWTTSISAGEILGFHVDSASAVTRVTVALIVEAS